MITVYRSDIISLSTKGNRDGSVFYKWQYGLGLRYLEVQSKKHLYFYPTPFLLMTVGAFVWQMFFTNIAGKFSVWGFSRGWQPKIALWNLGVDIGIAITLMKRNAEHEKYLPISVPLCIILEGHHLILCANSR